MLHGYAWVCTHACTVSPCVLGDTLAIYTGPSLGENELTLCTNQGIESLLVDMGHQYPGEDCAQPWGLLLGALTLAVCFPGNSPCKGSVVGWTGRAAPCRLEMLSLQVCHARAARHPEWRELAELDTASFLNERDKLEQVHILKLESKGDCKCL